MVPTQRRERWLDWLNTLRDDLYNVFLWRATWLTVGDMVRANPDIQPSHYFAYLANTYGTSQAVAVRRLADDRSDVVSLARLIKEVRKHATEITVEWWVGLDPNIDARDFGRFRASGADHFDPSIASDDLAGLRGAVADVKAYVDEHLADRDPSPTKDIPTFATIHAALDSVSAIFATYYTNLTGASILVFVPEPQIGWYRPFIVPWLAPGSKPVRLRGTLRGDPL